MTTLRAFRHNLTFHAVGDSMVADGPGNYRLTEADFLRVLDFASARDDVHLSFDDGYVSDVEIALPALQRRDLRADFFVVAGRLDQVGFLRREHLRELAEAGMGIGSHGMDHRPWKRMRGPELNREIFDAKEILEQVLGKPVTKAACPFGSYDRIVLRNLKIAGYERVYTSDGLPVDPEAWFQPRTTVHRKNVDRFTAGTAADYLAARNTSIRRLKTSMKKVL